MEAYPRVARSAVGNEPTADPPTGATPYDLRHSFASLMFHEQRNPLEIADMMGHSPQVLFSTYAHVIAELRGAAPISAEEQIRTARSTIHDEDADAVLAFSGRRPRHGA
jgi:integrase